MLIFRVWFMTADIFIAVCCVNCVCTKCVCLSCSDVSFQVTVTKAVIVYISQEEYRAAYSTLTSLIQLILLNVTFYLFFHNQPV